MNPPQYTLKGAREGTKCRKCAPGLGPQIVFPSKPEAPPPQRGSPRLPARRHGALRASSRTAVGVDGPGDSEESEDEEWLPSSLMATGGKV
jgi:hypothetical protein